MHYQSTTGLDHEEVTCLAARIHEVLEGRGVSLAHHSIGLYRQVEMTLLLLRQDVCQMTAAEMYGSSQPTVSRIYRRIMRLLDTVLAFTGITLEQAIEQRHQVLVDGTFIPTGNRPASGLEKENYSGKHHMQCVSIQVASTDVGELITVSDPVPGRRHDSKALELCGWKDTLTREGVTWIADTAYVGTNAITPLKRKKGQERSAWMKEFNKDVSSIRSHIEHCIGHLKDWKILAKGYRGRLTELPLVISVVTRLELFRLGW